MNESLYVISGASRGMGAAIAEHLLQPGHLVLGLSRKTNAELGTLAAQRGAQLLQWPRDLADPLPVAEELRRWLAGFEASRFDEAVLVNNAAAITPPGPVDECSFAELSAALRVGLEAVLLLTAAFVGGTRGWRATHDGRTKVLNISSGLGRRAMAGCAPYCAVKAGMDHFSRSMALDEAHRGDGARIVSLAPGVIDTDMQVQLRSADAAGFPDRGSFLQLQRSGQLSSPQDAAARVLAYLRRPDFGATAVADVRDA
ncbi:MAG TPA: SDR family NAD(P)-dependent oxidoreductase [Albitalea sp.]|nr:SDR family NAD(P)-dependent oxidoreductase [Albitalea sp.]